MKKEGNALFFRFTPPLAVPDSVPPQNGEARREYEYPITFRRVGY